MILNLHYRTYNNYNNYFHPFCYFPICPSHKTNFWQTTKESHGLFIYTSYNRLLITFISTTENYAFYARHSWFIIDNKWSIPLGDSTLLLWFFMSVYLINITLLGKSSFTKAGSPHNLMLTWCKLTSSQYSTNAILSLIILLNPSKYRTTCKSPNQLYII